MDIGHILIVCFAIGLSVYITIHEIIGMHKSRKIEKKVKIGSKWYYTNKPIFNENPFEEYKTEYLTITDIKCNSFGTKFIAYSFDNGKSYSDDISTFLLLYSPVE